MSITDFALLSVLFLLAPLIDSKRALFIVRALPVAILIGLLARHFWSA